MASIFSVQNLQTFLRRKNFLPPGPDPSRPPGPPGRGGRRSRSGRSPIEGRSPPEVGGLGVSVALVSSAMMLLSQNRRSSYVVGKIAAAKCLCRCCGCFTGGFRSGFHGWRSCGRLAARVLDGLDFVEALLLFVDAHGEKLDDRLSDAQTALEFVNQAAAALDRQQDVDAVVKFAHGVGEAALAEF